MLHMAVQHRDAWIRNIHARRSQRTRAYERSEEQMTEVAQQTTIQVNVLDLAGENRAIEGEIGHSLMEIIRSAGIEDIPAFCGGCCSCASCHVVIDPAFMEMLPPMSQDEEDLLDSSDHRAAGSRLSCQIPASAALSGIRLTIAPQD